MPKSLVCYYGSWAAYRKPPICCEIKDIDPILCTHLIYAFAVLDNDYNIKCHDPWLDLQKDGGGYKKAVSLKHKNPSLKVLIAIGGWNERSEKFSKMASNSTDRAKFIKSVLTFLSTHGFDGLDLDWEYPAYGPQGGQPADKHNFTTLVQELRQAFGKRYLLTAAIACGVDKLKAGYDLPKLDKCLDMINVMTYDYHGAWDSTVGANAPMKGAFSGDDLCVTSTINHLLHNGVNSRKLMLGVPFYGRTFKLQDPSTKTVVFGKTPISGGFPGPLIGEQNTIGYNEIRHELKNNSGSWKKARDDVTYTPYLRSGDRIISYDDSVSISYKVKFVKEKNLGGVMVWSVDTDDVHGLIPGKWKNFNLLRTIHNGLYSRK